MRWPLLYCALLAAIVGMVAVVRATVTLKKTDTAYILPEKWREIPTTEQAAYDPKDKMLYVVGGTFIHVLNISNPYAIKVVQNYTERESGDMTDVEICGDYLAVGYDSYVTPLQGKVFIFSRRSSERPMMKVNTITVGSLPDMVHFTEDCRRVVVAIEGELRKVNNMPIDPPGAVEVIRFVSDDLSGNYEVKIAHFFKFNSRAEDYVQKGVRWVYRGQGMSRPTEFYQDLEPEYIALSGVNKSIAYVALQENNGIAKVDIDRAEVLEIYPLGYKIWSETPIDPSDKDGGIRLNPWRVYGMFLPDTIKCVTIGGADYILTANEGDAKEYEMDTHGVEWSEEKRGKQFSTENLLDPSMPASLRGEIADDAKLGRMTFTTVDGRNQATGKFKSLYSFGGRSFSVFRASDMSLVYDSAGHVEQRIAESYPRIFNADIKDIDQRPDQTMDIRSSKKGPETESMATAQIGDRLYVFVGHERPGIISIYSFPHNDFTNVQHEGIYQGLGPLDNTKSWRQKYEDKEIEFIDPEDIIYVPAEQSSKGKPLLVVTGAKSNSVNVYEIIIGTSDTSGDGSSAAMTQTSLLTSFLACLITYCIAFTR